MPHPNQRNRPRAEHLRRPGLHGSKTSSLRADRLSWLDVVVHTEKVCRVVSVFQGDKAIVIAAVGFARDGFAVICDVVAVSACD
jgi:hypothetical protein